LAGRAAAATAAWPVASLAYWADLGLVRGRETSTAFSDAAGGLQRAGASSSRRVRGHAVDLGATWTFGELWRPTLTLGWAAGSGSAPGAAVNRNYRQTGLQENKVRLSGMKRLQRYGELFDPELSNLRVATASFGLRVRPDASIELAAHHYRQRVAAPIVADMRLSQSPAGISPRLGRKVDLLFAWRPSSQVELTLLLARFLPGDAFAANRRDPATSIELGLDIAPNRRGPTMKLTVVGTGYVGLVTGACFAEMGTTCCASTPMQDRTLKQGEIPIHEPAAEVVQRNVEGGGCTSPPTSRKACASAPCSSSRWARRPTRTAPPTCSTCWPRRAPSAST
jgi:hypothetical protein